MDYGKAESWIEDLTYILNKKAMKSFELQLYNPSGVRFKSYRYEVNMWGQVTSGDKSGGINYFDFPASTKISLFAELDKSSNNYASVLKELTEIRGWGTNGSAMNGNATREKNYVSNSLQLSRSVI